MARTLPVTHLLLHFACATLAAPLAVHLAPPARHMLPPPTTLPLLMRFWKSEALRPAVYHFDCPHAAAPTLSKHPSLLSLPPLSWCCLAAIAHLLQPLCSDGLLPQLSHAQVTLLINPSLSPSLPSSCPPAAAPTCAAVTGTPALQEPLPPANADSKVVAGACSIHSGVHCIT